MRLWRISNFPDLSGEGGRIAPGRWHTVGRRNVYLADHPASAVLEMIVNQNISVGDLPARYQLIAVDIPDHVSFTAISEAELPPGWRRDRAATRTFGDRWLNAGESLLLRVPSAIVPHAFNWLLNPDHVGASLATITEIIQADFDARLFR